MGGSPPVIYSPRVSWAMRSVSRQAQAPSRAPPFTYHMLEQVHASLLYTRDNVTHFTAMLLAYFACMRTAEFCPSPGVAPHLTIASLSFVSAAPPYMVVSVASAKTSIKGYKVVVGCSGTPICAYCWMCFFISRYPPSSSAPLFTLATGVPVSHGSLSRAIRSFAMQAGLPLAHYTPHSLRAGAATDAAQAGASDSAVQQLGRWTSSAYRVYMRPSQAQQALVSGRLASGRFTH